MHDPACRFPLRRSKDTSKDDGAAVKEVTRIWALNQEGLSLASPPRPERLGYQRSMSNTKQGDSQGLKGVSVPLVGVRRCSASMPRFASWKLPSGRKRGTEGMKNICSAGPCDDAENAAVSGKGARRALIAFGSNCSQELRNGTEPAGGSGAKRPAWTSWMKWQRG